MSKKALKIRIKVGVLMSVTTYNQHKTGVFMPHKQNRSRTKCIKKAVENLDDACSSCSGCKQAILLTDGVYCGRLREQVSNTSNCPHFDLEPLEYKLYRRVLRNLHAL